MDEKVEAMPVESRIDFDLPETDRRQPKYTRVKDHFLRELKANRLRPGQSLPTEVELANALEVARGTVRQALGELEREGVVERIRGKGTFISKSVRHGSKRRLSAFALVVQVTGGGQYPAIQRGFENAAGEAHNQVIVAGTDNDVLKQGNVLFQLLDKEVAGVAIAPATTTATPAYQIHPLQRHGIPVVFLHRRVEGVRAPLLSIPFHEVGHTVGRAFLEQGHRRVALFTGVQSDKASQAYESALRETMRAGGGDLPEGFTSHWQWPDMTVEGRSRKVRKELEQLLSGPDRPTGIMATFDTTAEVIYLLLGRMGVQVPEDISLIGFGGKNRQGAILHELTSVVVDGAWVGHQAGELLVEMRDGRRPLDDHEEIVIPISMSEGRTLGPVPKTVLSLSSS
jgi:DNA-binding LacI/PurR family transcriptional regulator